MNSLLISLPVIIVMGLIPTVTIVDIMNSSFRGMNAKWIWCSIVVFFPIVGPLLYFWIGRQQRVFLRQQKVLISRK